MCVLQRERTQEEARITIYRQASCADCRSEAEVVEQVRRGTVVHEVGHQFGIDDGRLHALGFRSIRWSASLVHLAGDRPSIRHRRHVPELVGLLTERIVWICPPSTSSVKVPSTLLSRSRKIAPGWPFTSRGSNVTSIRTSQGKIEASTRATF
jgi:hypothetical protein